jgi:transposase
VSGNNVEILVHARRFHCDVRDCSRRIFCERFPGILEPYARLTNRAQAALLELAHASSAEQAARVAGLYGFRVSPDTLLKLQRREAFPLQSPAVIGIDEFAWKKRMRYGTIIVDLERRRPVDLLPTDSAEKVAEWLSRHPGITVMARDRDEVFAQAARTAVPKALQVADRFHLVQNVTETFRTFVHSRRWEVPAAPNLFQQGTPDWHPQEAAAPVRSPGGPTLRKVRLWEQVRHLARQGRSIREIARALGVHRRTVRIYRVAPSPPAYPAGRIRGHRKITPYMDHLRRRWAEGTHNTRVLYEEVRRQGYRGGRTQVLVTVRPWRTRSAHLGTRSLAPPYKLLFQWNEKLVKEEEIDELVEYLRLNPDLAAAYGLKESFRAALKSKHPVRLDQWLTGAEASGIAGFLKLASGMRHDYAAVSASFSSRWSNGQTEGQNTRVKLIKRIGYGRAKPDLLRARVLHRAIAAA